MAGDKSFYVVQRAWLLPPFTPEAIPISGPQFDEASKVISFGHACQLGNQARQGLIDDRIAVVRCALVERL